MSMALRERKRIQLLLDSPIYEAVRMRADTHAISLSAAIRDLIKEALQWEATLELYRSPKLMKNLEAGLADEKRGYIIREKD